VAGIAFSGSATVWIVALFLWWRIRSQEQVWFAWGRFAAAILLATAILFAIPWSLLFPWAPVRVVAGAAIAWVAYTVVMWPAIRRMQAYERLATEADSLT
jgi:peptidoglycan biosynthesis protein MviN/MurJ (putative lipid II flippase)